MSLPEPAWRLRTRPCPFYHQGRCIFAATCNFLHAAPSQSFPDADMDGQLAGSEISSVDSTPAKPPLISIESPRSIRSPRSPRLASLLLALKDVLGDEPEDDSPTGYTDPDTTIAITNDSWSAGAATLVENSVAVPEMAVNIRPFSPPSHPTPPSNNKALLDDQHPFLHGVQSQIYDTTDKDAELHSDTRLQDDTHASAQITHPGVNAIKDFPVVEDNGNYSADPSYPIARDNLLSPVGILSNLQLTNFQRASMDMIEFDDDDTWRLPFPPVLSPPRSPVPTSTFNLLASPFGIPGERVLSPRLSAFLGRHSTATSSGETDIPTAHDSDLDSPETQQIPASTQISPVPPSATELIFDAIADALEESEAAAEKGEGDMIGFWSEQSRGWNPANANGSEVAEEEGSSVLDEIDEDRVLSRNAEAPCDRHLPAKSPPLVTQDISIESPVIPTPETADFEDVDDQVNVDLTATSAYLEPNEEDQAGDGGSFISLYGAYSDFSPLPLEVTMSVGSHDYQLRDTTLGESSSISTPLSFIQERVFTPSSSQERTRLDVDSPSHSPPRSQHSTRLNSAFDVQSENREVVAQVDELKSPSSQGDGGSRKVPFGWRQSLASNRSSKTSRTSRTSRTMTKPSLRSLRSPPPADDPPSLSSSPSSPLPPNPPSRLRPLRLSVILNSYSQQSSRSAPPCIPESSISRSQRSQNHHVSMSISTVSSNNRPSHSHTHSSRFSLISDRIRSNLMLSDGRVPSPLTSDSFAHLSNFGPPQSAPLPHSHIWRRASIYSVVSQEDYPRSESSFSYPDIRPINEEDDDNIVDEYESHDQKLEYDDDDGNGDVPTYGIILPSAFPAPPHSAPIIQPNDRPFYHAVSTAKPTLMFAIASDDVAEVKRVLESGEAEPNDAVGPQTALEFALTNDQLLNKMDIVKTLLAYGADPRVVKQPNATIAPRRASATAEGAASDVIRETEAPVASLMDDIDPALKYYVERADAPHTRRSSALIHRSFFRPLTRVRYELVGQDCVLEQLFKVLSIQSRGLSVAPIVVLLCGPSGHGKSLLARKFGSLLDVPTHTVNMTTLKSTHDLWQSYSMSPYETPTTCTLAEFLINNEGKRCVVVLDEIEKTDEKTLWSLLMPWELGRCSFETGSRFIDVRNVVWIGTSNIGHDLVFKHQESRERPNELMTREEYVDLMGLLRPRVSERLGASVLSRVTTVLPFVPFTTEEKKAICSEALFSLGGEDVRSLSSRTIESVIQNALGSYCPVEGARSLYRAISNQLIDII